MSREFCARVLCGERASAALLINARDLSAQVMDIGEEAGIAGVPLCRAHADGVVVPVGWAQADLRSPYAEPELVLVDDADSDSPDQPQPLRLPNAMEAVDDGEEEAAGGEVPPLLSRAFRAAGLD